MKNVVKHDNIRMYPYVKKSNTSKRDTFKTKQTKRKTLLRRCLIGEASLRNANRVVKKNM